MAHFKYRALDADGVAQNGTLQATDQSAAAATLQKRGLLVLSLHASATSGPGIVMRRSALSGAALVSFTQQLATLIGAGQRFLRRLRVFRR